MADNLIKVSTSELSKGIDLCFVNARHLLDSATLLLNRGGVNHAYIFWAFAVEEYGKALLLKETKRKADALTVEIDRTNLFFGRLAHARKFDRGLKELNVSKVIRKVARITYNVSNKNHALSQGKNFQISIPTFCTGLFEDTTNTDNHEEETRHGLREKFLYVDLQHEKFQAPEAVLGIVSKNGLNGHFTLSTSTMLPLMKALHKKLHEE